MSSEELERWAPVPNYETWYAVSSHGRLKSVRRNCLLSVREGKAWLWDRTHKSVGRFVLMAFVGPPPTPDHIALHLDGDPDNVRLDNLKWATEAERERHRLLTGRRPAARPRAPRPKKVPRRPTAWMPEEMVREMRRRYAAGEKQVALVKRFGRSAAVVHNAVHFKSFKDITP